MKALKHLTRLTLLLVFIGFTSCSDDDNGPMPPEQEGDNIVEAAQATAELSTLVAALQKADESANNDLVAALSGEGPFTVLPQPIKHLQTCLHNWTVLILWMILVPNNCKIC